MNEKRAYPRFTMELCARYKAPGSSLHALTMVAINIGAGGICFIAKNPFQTGTTVELELELKEKEMVVFQGQVIWAEKISPTQFKMGIKIVDADEEQMERFVKFYCYKVFDLPPLKKKILVIEDEKALGELLRMELELADYQVVCAADGEEGYAKYLTEHPDLVILDLLIPKLNGFEVCRRIRREQKDEETIILMLSALKDDVDRIRGRVIGAHNFLTKPFEVEELLQEIKTLLSGQTRELKSGKQWGGGQ